MCNQQQYTVKQEDLIGELKNFPIEVVQKMIERQVEQGNPPCVKVFQKYAASSRQNKGFDWDMSPEKDSFWSKIVFGINFDLFFEKYPKYPKVMWVSNDEYEYFPRVVFMEKKGKYLAWEGATTLKEAEDAVQVRNWEHATPVEKCPVELTLDEIAEKFNIPVSQLKIKK